jgi:hypothetical protein
MSSASGQARGSGLSRGEGNRTSTNMYAGKECYWCTEKGHIKRDCRAKVRDIANGIVRTPRQGTSTGQGSQARQANSRQNHGNPSAGGRGNYGPGVGGQPRQPETVIQRCGNCSGFGHLSDRCSYSRNPPSGSNGRAAAVATRLDQTDD